MGASTFNRKFVNKRKMIRDRKKAHIVGGKRKGDVIVEVPLTKKEQKRQSRLEKIYEKEGVKPNFFEKKPIKRRNKNSGKYTTNTDSNEMNIDN